jgi:hypothetical protein
LIEQAQKANGAAGDAKKRGVSNNARGREASNNRAIGGGNDDQEGQKKS